jgi:hypothetical protein
MAGGEMLAFEKAKKKKKKKSAVGATSEDMGGKTSSVWGISLPVA